MKALILCSICSILVVSVSNFFMIKMLIIIVVFKILKKTVTSASHNFSPSSLQR